MYYTCWSFEKCYVKNLILGNPIGLDTAVNDFQNSERELKKCFLSFGNILHVNSNIY